MSIKNRIEHILSEATRKTDREKDEDELRALGDLWGDAIGEHDIKKLYFYEYQIQKADNLHAEIETKYAFLVTLDGIPSIFIKGGTTLIVPAKITNSSASSNYGQTV